MKRKKLAEKPISKAINLSRKEKGFVKDYVKTGNGTQSILKNYDTTPSTAGVIAVEYLRKPKIQKAIQEYLPDELLSQVHLEGLGATNIDEPDYQVRSKYLDMAYKLKGSYAAEKSITFQMNFTPDPKTVELANEYEERLKKGL